MDAALKQELLERMKGALAALKDDLSTLRTGRASASILDHITVDAYGSRVPLNQVATINVPEARLITVQPWDRKLVHAIDKGIRESDLGLNPISDGVVLRVPLPELTQERRKELVRLVHKYGETAKVAVRNVRRDGMDKLKKMEKSKSLSKDDLHLQEKELQELTDKYIADIEAVIGAKETDVMQV